MEDKKLLNDKELHAVVGGLADARHISRAFQMAANEFYAIWDDRDENMEITQIVGQMYSICLRMSKQAMPSDTTVNEYIRELEELYSALVNTRSHYIPDRAREILNELKRKIGL